jgi:cytochrome c556
MTAAILAIFIPLVMASDDPVHERHEMMEEVRDGAKAIGGMIKGETQFDGEAAMAALLQWQTAAQEFGHLFPEGSYTGDPETAREEVWTDREGFDELLTKFDELVDDAITANPQTSDELGQAAGPIFDVCKKCHEGYRLEDD